MPLLPQKANVPGNNDTLDDRSPVPAGKYPGAIVKSEFKETKAKTGHYLALQLKIIEGQYKGRVLFTNLNLDNPNQVAVEIANKELNSICKACNKEGVEDSEELHNIPMMLTVKVTEGDASYPPSNEITAYEPYEGTPRQIPPVSGETPPTETPSPEPNEAPQAAQEQKKSKLPWE